MSDGSTSFLKRLFEGDRVLWAVTLILSIFSGLVNFSATSQLVNKTGDVNGEAIGHGLALLIGLLIAIVVHHRLSLKWIKKGTFISLGIALFLLMAMTFPGMIPSFMSGIIDVSTLNSASRWVKVLGFTFQPSEIAKLALVASVAYYLTVPVHESSLFKFIAKRLKKDLDDEKFVRNTRFTLFIVTMLLVTLPITMANMSTGVIVYLICLSMLWLSDVWNKAVLVMLVATMLFGGAFALVLKHGHDTGNHVFSRGETWYNRTISFLLEDENTKYNYNDYTSQVVHSQIAISRSGLIGLGPGNSRERDVLPQIFADFVFAIIIEEYGLFFGMLTLSAYLALLYRCGMIAKRVRDPYISLLVLGIGTIITMQALISAGVSVHLGPVTGQPLPLISRGRTSILITFLAIGVIERLAVLSLQKNEQDAVAVAETAEAETENETEENAMDEEVAPDVTDEAVAEQNNETEETNYNI